MNSILLKAFLFTACATFSYPIFAAQSETFQVSATIDTGCLINGALTEESNTQIGTIGELNFGEHSAIYAAEVEGSITYNGGLTLSCTIINLYQEQCFYHWFKRRCECLRRPTKDGIWR